MAVTQATAGRGRSLRGHGIEYVYTRARERTLAYRGLITRGAPLRLHPRYRPSLVFRPTLTRSPR